MTERVVLFERAVDGFGRIVDSIREASWHDPTPDTEWDVRMLVNHVTVEQMWVPPLLDGSSIAEVGGRLDGDQLGHDPAATWHAAVAASIEAFGAPGALDRTVSLSTGEQTTAQYCWEMTTDALVHTWDLARAVGAGERLDPELVDLVYEATVPYAAQLHETGLFAPIVPVPDDSAPQTKLLAIFGRRE